MILSGALRELGYLQIPLLGRLDSKSFVETIDAIKMVKPWSELRDVFEYVSCMECAVERLDSLPVGNALGSVNLTPARYDSAALVFFAQATLDNLAVWMNSVYSLGLSNSEISFYKNKMPKLLTSIDPGFKVSFDEYGKFVRRLNDYRMEWLHKISGGAEMYGDGVPGFPEANTQILVPLDPKINSVRFVDHKEYCRRVTQCEKENDGKWLIPVSDFAHEIKESTLALVLSLLEVSEKHFP